MVFVSFSKCIFTNSLIIFGLVILFVRLYCRYIQDVFRRQCPFKGYVFFLIQLTYLVVWFTVLFNVFLLCVLIFDLMLDIHEWLTLIVFLLNIFLYLCIGGKFLFIKGRKSLPILFFTDLSKVGWTKICFTSKIFYLFCCFVICFLFLFVVFFSFLSHNMNHDFSSPVGNWIIRN